MNPSELKEYIIKNNKIELILEKLECTHIKNYKNEIRFAIHNIKSGSITIKKDTLSVVCYSTHIDLKGDIITLVMQLHNIAFHKALGWLHEVLNLEFNKTYVKKEEPKTDILAIFKNAKRRRSTTKEELTIYHEDLLIDCIQIPYIGWVREGIIPPTQKEFGIGYNVKTNRVIIPHRMWCGSRDDYVGLIGRTINPNYELLDIPKYFPLKAYPKSQNLYGLNENYMSIQKAGYVNIFESEKSVLKRHSKCDKTGVSLGGHSLSDEQVKILISLNVDIIIQMDNDVPEDKVLEMCEQFKGIRKVYYVIDKFNLLDKKECAADKPNKVYQFLWNRKIVYEKKNSLTKDSIV